MNRINQIISHDPEWGSNVKDFIEAFPEFSKFQEIAPLESGRKNSNKLNLFKQDKGFVEPDTIFENIIYYVAGTGVRFAYAITQWNNLHSFIHRGDWNQNLIELSQFINDNNIQPAKKAIYCNIIYWMVNHNINKDTISMDNVFQMRREIKGLGISFEGFMKTKFTDLDNFCEYTDIGFKGGFKKVYGTSTTAEIKKKSELFIEMGFGRVANRFMFQIYHYANKIGL